MEHRNLAAGLLEALCSQSDSPGALQPCSQIIVPLGSFYFN
jgi:hypothetical protein